jgi:hypothetical protein
VNRSPTNAPRAFETWIHLAGGATGFVAAFFPVPESPANNALDSAMAPAEVAAFFGFVALGDSFGLAT